MLQGIEGAGTLTEVESAMALRVAAVRPMGRGGWAYWTLFTFLTAVIAAGATAWIYQLINGLGATGLNQNVTWGVYTADIVTFIGLSYGGALVSAILRLTGATWRAPITRIAEACAVVTLLIGAAFPIIHLGRPERVWLMFVEPNGTSPMIWDTLAILTYLFATVIFFYLPIIPDLATLLETATIRVGATKRRIWRLLAAGWRDLPEQHRALNRALGAIAVLIVPIAVVVHSVLAWAFSVNTRPGWHSTIFAPYFVIAALFSGVALVVVVVAVYRQVYRLQSYIHEKQFRYLGYIILALGLTYLYFTFAEMLTEGYASTSEGLAVISPLLAGRYAPYFWSWLGLGLIVPLLLIALRWTRTIAGITAASVLIVVGMWVKRLLIVIPPMELSLIGHQVVPYTPSLIELAITAAAAAAIPWMLMIVFRFVPVLPIYEIEEVEHGGGLAAVDAAPTSTASTSARGFA